MTGIYPSARGDQYGMLISLPAQA
jgi:hypothetical protein